MPYLHDDFLLDTKTSQRLFHEVAANQPIMDYHCHLPPEEVAGDQRFGNIAEIWLGGDHYKWRAMRAAGIPEELITGKDTDPKEKFLAWARTLPKAIRNPLHHWAHLELKRYFDCHLVLDETTADEIWELTNAKLAEPEFSTQNILKNFDVRALGTTDDPVDSLEHHIAFAKSGHTTKMFPTFRPDKAMQVHDPDAWRTWTERLSTAADREIGGLEDFLLALKQRHDFFHEAGCRLSDHGIDFCPYAACGDRAATAIFEKLLAKDFLSPEESEQWQTFILQTVGRWNCERGWTMQFHMGAIRNTNRRMFDILGADTGYDAMHDEAVVRKLAAFLNSLASSDELPKCIFYHVNPAALYPLATLMGSYQDGKTAGKMQLGSGWWHVDTLDGMRTQMEVLSSVGLISQFVGMLTDSRSFLSFPRHEYFRRLVCQIFGRDVEAGLIPDDTDLLDATIRGICFDNARAYFNFPGV